MILRLLHLLFIRRLLKQVSRSRRCRTWLRLYVHVTGPAGACSRNFLTELLGVLLLGKEAITAHHHDLLVLGRWHAVG